MKLINLFEHSTPSDDARILNELRQKITSDCQPYVNAVTRDGLSLYRGLGAQYVWNADIIKPPKNRKPVATPDIVHTAVDDAVKTATGFAARSQGIFCTTDAKQADIYGKSYLIFPRGDFTCHWIPGVYDLYLVMRGGDMGTNWNGKFARDLAKEAARLMDMKIDDFQMFMGDVWFGEPIYDDRLAALGGRDTFLALLFHAVVPKHVVSSRNSVPSVAKNKSEIMLEAPNGYFMIPKNVAGPVDEMFKELSVK